MSDAISCDSGTETDYNFSELNDQKDEESKGARSMSGYRKKLGGNLSGTPKKLVIKSSDPSKPPL